ncbi:hypothetical protein UFOVP1483_37 [uncultured Caudovirales phage]|uniref:Uncharacterized protein n=1 Tax=uncultured Caudovirales phage TaxID=2100421 RepID=A0A6J5SL99_9CAUD|nr:hypothetical protein UFOVP1483_37 [uncultured Caudovirales phage]
MTPSILAIFISVCTAIIVASILGVISWIKKTFKNHNNRNIIVSIQVESMLEGFKNVNHNWGNEFKEGYDKKYHELIEKHNFINHN